MSWANILSSSSSAIEPTSVTDIENNQANGRLYPLTSFSVLEISGPDRFSFLQGQATCDTARLENGEALLGAHLNLKGRIEASFIAIPAEDSLHLILPEGQAAYLLTLLQKYALFSQAELKENDQLLPYLHWAEATEEHVYNNANIPHINIGVLAAGNAESRVSSFELGTETDAKAILAINGLQLVEAQQQGLYLPQELNYDQIDGISFKKGCYKGQEVVARIHFKGQVKQRLAPFITDGSAAHKAPAFNDSQQKCAEVITTYQTSDQSHEAVGCVLLKTSETESKTLNLEQNDGPKLRLVALPYAIN